MERHELIVDSVVVRFGEETVLSGGYITSSTGCVTGLLGRNGTGKSCMFRALMGGLPVENVMVSIDGQPVDRKTIGLLVKYLPQGRLIPGGVPLKRAFQLYGVNFWDFVNRFPVYARYHDSAIWELIRERSRDHGIIVTDHNFDAITTVAGNLFIISDGYTHPVQGREDLVRYGYLRD